MAEEVQKKSFTKNMKQELKKVIWPTRKQTVKNTMAVICIVFLVSATVLILDFAFTKGNDLVIDGVTGGKVTEYRIETQRKTELLAELKGLVDENTYSQYASIAYYLSVEDLEEMIEKIKNPTQTDETAGGEGQQAQETENTEGAETTQPATTEE